MRRAVASRASSCVPETRFDQIVVGAGLEAGEDFVFRVMRRAQHDVDVARIVRTVADRARELEPVHARHVAIEDDDGRELRA